MRAPVGANKKENISMPGCFLVRYILLGCSGKKMHTSILLEIVKRKRVLMLTRISFSPWSSNAHVGQKMAKIKNLEIEKGKTVLMLLEKFNNSHGAQQQKSCLFNRPNKQGCHIAWATNLVCFR